MNTSERISQPVALIALLLIGAIFGFFYAWVCSTMWGLDSADPRVAIEAMQAMNASVRNTFFAPAMFGAPVALILAGMLRWKTGAGLWFLAAAAIYVLFSAVVTFAIHVPMNEGLAATEIPDNIEAAREIWQAYSGPWQFWNQFRTIACGLALILTGIALLKMEPVNAPA